MSRTALRCFIALGISISFAAACGDDDDGGGGNGGSAGNAGSSGMAGSSGGGSGGDAGSAGSGGSSAGSSGTGGTGGDQGGTGGDGDGGTGGDEQPDGGPDGGPDGSVEDASVGGTGGTGATTADCPANQNNIVTADNSQVMAVVRVLFEDDDVVIRNVARQLDGGPGESQSLSSVFLCNGPEDCVELNDDGNCDESGTDDDDLDFGEEVVCEAPGNLAEGGGELGLLNDEPVNASAFIFSYLTWGTFTSQAPAGGDAGDPPDNLEDRASPDFWIDGNSIAAPTGTEDAIFATGDLGAAAGYDTCTQD